MGRFPAHAIPPLSPWNNALSVPRGAREGQQAAAAVPLNPFDALPDHHLLDVLRRLPEKSYDSIFRQGDDDDAEEEEEEEEEDLYAGDLTISSRQVRRRHR